jgi:hypothetical protein
VRRRGNLKMRSTPGPVTWKSVNVPPVDPDTKRRRASEADRLRRTGGLYGPHR